MILAAGLGKRLKSVVSDRPKPMAAGEWGKPFLDYLVKRLISHGITDIVICVSFMKESITDYFSKNYKEYVRFSEEDVPLGSGSTLKNAKELIDGRFFLLYGDAYTLVDYRDLLAHHIRNKADITMTLHVGDCSRGGCVKLDGDRIIEFSGDPRAGQGLKNAGVSVIERSIIDRIPDTHDIATGENSFERETIQRLVKEGSAIVDGYTLDSDVSIGVGSPDSYKYLLQNPGLLEK